MCNFRFGAIHKLQNQNFKRRGPIYAKFSFFGTIHKLHNQNFDFWGIHKCIFCFGAIHKLQNWNFKFRGPIYNNQRILAPFLSDFSMGAVTNCISAFFGVFFMDGLEFCKFSIVKSCKDHSLKISAQSDENWQTYGTLSSREGPEP